MDHNLISSIKAEACIVIYVAMESHNTEQHMWLHTDAFFMENSDE